MGKKNNWSVEQEILQKFLTGTGKFISSKLRKLWDLLFFQVLRQKNGVIIYGEMDGKIIHDRPANRNSHTSIKGKPGFGKSATAANLAIQNIEQGTRTLVIDPHGDVGTIEKGISAEIFKRAENTDNIVFLSINQKQKIIGYNPLFLLAQSQKLDELRDNLMSALIYDSKDGINKGYEVANAAKFLIDSAIYFNNAYPDWLLAGWNKNGTQLKNFTQTHQLTINDLANLDTNPKLIDLFIYIFSQAKNKYYRPDLATKWQAIKESKKFDSGMIGVIGRLKKVVSMDRAELFFESNGFNLAEELANNKSVLCDISNLDAFSTAIISRLILVKVFGLHKSAILKKQTEFYIDEASNVEIANLPQIIDQGRKYDLAISLIYQNDNQFDNPKIKNAIRRNIVTKINFRNTEGDFNTPVEKIANLKKRHFVLENSRGVWENVRSLDMPKPKRKVEVSERGVAREELKEQIKNKQIDILNYFLKV